MPLGGIGRFEGEVFVDLEETRFGRPLRVTRDLLKRGDSWGLQVRDVERVALLSASDAEKYLTQLVGAGYLTAPGTRERCYDCQDFECYHPDSRRWNLTAKGRTLGHASGRQPSTRKRANALARWRPRSSRLADSAATDRDTSPIRDGHDVVRIAEALRSSPHITVVALAGPGDEAVWVLRRRRCRLRTVPQRCGAGPRR